MITLQLLVVALIAEMPFVGNTFSVWDIGLIGLITIVLRLLCTRLLKVKGFANAVSFDLSLMTAAIPMIYYIYWHAVNGADYTIGANIAMVILCGAIWFVFWRYINPWYYTKVDGSIVEMSFIPYFKNNIVLLVIDGLIQLLPMTVFVCYAWYGFAGHFHAPALACIIGANIVWIGVFITLVNMEKKKHPAAVIEKRKDPYSDPIEKETDARFEVKLSKKNHMLLTVCQIVVLYAAFCLDGLYYDKIHNDVNDTFISTAALAFLVSVAAVVVVYFLQDRLSLRIIVNKKRFGIHRLFAEAEIVDEKNVDNYEIGTKGSSFTLYYDSAKDITVDGLYENVDKLKAYITEQTKIEKYTAPTPEEKAAKKAKAKALRDEKRAAEAAKKAERKASAPERKAQAAAAKKARKAAEKAAKLQAQKDKEAARKKALIEKNRKALREKKAAEKRASKVANN